MQKLIIDFLIIFEFKSELGNVNIYLVCLNLFIALKILLIASFKETFSSINEFNVIKKLYLLNFIFNIFSRFALSRQFIFLIFSLPNPPTVKTVLGFSPN